jgi:uncharacterized protein
MNTSGTGIILINLFTQLRRSGFTLGMGELLAALEAVGGGWGADNEEMKQVIQFLWCHSREERDELEIIWPALTGASSETGAGGDDSKKRALSFPPPEDENYSTMYSQETNAMLYDKAGNAEWEAQPVRTPFMPLAIEGRSDLNTYWPITRRHMAYSWRYLRRPVADGPEEILDIEKTINQVARQGFFLAPAYRRRERNRAHLILLIDQGGSMVPFHHFTRDLIETAQQESNIEKVEGLYFHNVPAQSLYIDPFMNKPVLYEYIAAQFSGDTSVLIVSDAGAARGYRRLERIHATSSFLLNIKQSTSLIAWMNPMPKERWPGTSAQIISNLIPMFQMDKDGFSNAIDVVRGQPILR